MPNIVNFNNRQIVEPGVYSRIVGGGVNQTTIDTYGSVLLIDTGSGAGFGGGSGINGEISSGEASVYQVKNVIDAQKFIGGGILWDLMNYLWNPTTNGNGPQNLYIIRASTTTGANKSLTLAPGNISIKAKNEGLRGNGSVLTTGSSTYLTKGYAMRVSAGTINPNALVVTFYEGQYRGKDSNGNEYDLSEVQVRNSIVCQSIEFTTSNQFINWANFTGFFFVVV